MPIAGTGFALQVPIPVQSWLGGSRQDGQNFPRQCWQVKGRVHSLPQWSQCVIIFIMVSGDYEFCFTFPGMPVSR
jgi:hypothetical protein